MREPIYYPSDLLLTLGKSPVSTPLSWRIGSDLSHCIPVTRFDTGLNITWPRPAPINLRNLDARRVVHLRPTVPFNPEQMAHFWAAAAVVAASGYDLKSWWGWLTGRGSQARRRYNCAEGALHMYKAAGLLLTRDEHLISPQSFFEAAHAGLFTIVSDRRF